MDGVFFFSFNAELDTACARCFFRGFERATEMGLLGLAVRGCDWGWEIEMEGRKEGRNVV